MYYYSFENLDVWKVSRSFTTSIYKTTDKFPEIEKFGIVSQLRRASVSICSNIAEGNSRISVKEKAHFIRIAYSSAMEVLNQLIISSDLNFIGEKQLNQFRIEINEITNKLNALHKRIINKKK